VNGSATPRRAVCARCLRPQATCLCALVCPTAHLTEVLVLQHPQEVRQAKNSVALLRLSLAHCEVVVGERFSHEALAGLLYRPGRDTWLLYPDVPAAPAPFVLSAAHLQPSPCRLPAPGVPHTQNAPSTPPTPPVSPASCVVSGPKGSGGACVRLVVIDATWRKSLRMLLEHRALAELPRLSLDMPAPTRYRAIRAARRMRPANPP